MLLGECMLVASGKEISAEEEGDVWL